MAGEQVDIVVKDSGGVVGQTAYTFPERGHVERVDFGAPLDDADGNGLPDLWELAWLGSAGQDPNALGQNGLSLMDNYVAGTDPEDPNDLFRVEITETNGPIEVAFFARRAEGPGYGGTTRYYSLESQSLSGAGGWQEVAGVVDVAGNNQTVIHNTGSAEPTLVYRARVGLAAVQIPGGPALTIAALGGGQVELSWPMEASGFVLQESSSLDGTGWSDVAGSPTNDGNNWSMQVAAPTGARFWRLRE